MTQRALTGTVFSLVDYSGAVTKYTQTLLMPVLVTTTVHISILPTTRHLVNDSGASFPLN